MSRRPTDPSECAEHDWNDWVLPACKVCYEPQEVGWQVHSRIVAQEISRDQAREKHGPSLYPCSTPEGPHENR